ncbi:hypothetical protein C4J83_2739 [Pseudomonas sp. LBUM920]|nr:hypothetical protein C4J83_2739 [Pseudomonas sp. LBUM920]
MGGSDHIALTQTPYMPAGERRARYARMFICAETKIGKCKSLGDQVRVCALRRGGGWRQAREDLAKQAERWFGHEPVTTKQDWQAIRAEVFRTD